MPDSLQLLPALGRIGVAAAGLLILAIASSSCQPSTEPMEVSASSETQASTQMAKELQTATFAMG